MGEDIGEDETEDEDEEITCVLERLGAKLGEVVAAMFEEPEKTKHNKN